MELIAYGITFVVLGGWHIASELLHRKRESELLNRIMSKSYEEFEYYSNKYGKDLKELDNIRDEARKERKNEVINPGYIAPNEEPSLEGFEEDWADDEVDKKALKEQEDK